ncbi:VOC family protein [Symbioplanes lichenis]|uniref:VOC family protein n=1 Tax=Symbioplanes lichenis TaxID=1629072 RepID=UPI0027384F20|nr:VOC family protein [Actinoplanes lichenis]
MTAHLDAICFAALHPAGLARFWSDVLGRPLVDDPHADAALAPVVEGGYRIRFRHTTTPKTVQNLAHFDLTSTSLEDQQEKVARILELGGKHWDVGQTGDEGHVVLADPEDNEVDVIEPGNNFLKDTGLIGALAGDGSPAVGQFWSSALGWPLVWDQDEETAIQSPRGGTKITWGGPPYGDRTGADRVTFDLAAPAADLDRLVALGATLVDGPDDRGRYALTDPDGTPFRVLT